MATNRQTSAHSYHIQSTPSKNFRNLTDRVLHSNWLEIFPLVIYVYVNSRLQHNMLPFVIPLGFPGGREILKRSWTPGLFSILLSES